ncbi:MAG: hypothetical protein U0168_15890 [Nannocystaceae bacterium]
MSAATSASSDSGADQAASTGSEGPSLDACAEACEGAFDRVGLLHCQACRCKAAFDDWLPGADALQCDAGEPIQIYRADVSGEAPVLEQASPSAANCANPALLNGSCGPGSRLGTIVHDDVVVRWICRDPLLDADGRVRFRDAAIIGHNRRTGATCFWDDIDETTHDDDLPPLDLLTATDAERQEFLDRFHYNDGSRCISCHDHDPFIYTPFLQSVSWTSFAPELGPYALVERDGRLVATGKRHLVSTRAQPCTQCHRLGDDGTCRLLAPDALGASKRDGHQQAVLDAMVEGSPHWTLAYWMPIPGLLDHEAWAARFADARAHVLACCETPGEDVGDCVWQPVPGA